MEKAEALLHTNIRGSISIFPPHEFYHFAHVVMLKHVY